MNIDEKACLRRQMKEKRKALFDGSAQEKAQENILSLPKVKAAKSVFVYNSFGTELPTRGLIERILSLGKEVYLPRVEGERMAAVRFTPDTKMRESKFHILEPTGEEFTKEADVTVLPLLAVTKKGERLGYGGGYYDRYLEHKNCYKVAYCFDFQVVDEVFASFYDVKADVIVTEKRIIYVEG